MEPKDEVKQRRSQHWHLKDRDRPAPAEESGLKSGLNPVAPAKSGPTEPCEKAREDFELQKFLTGC